MIGEDDCDTGLFCAFWGVPEAVPQTRQCLELGTADDQCDEGGRCVSPHPTSTRMGLCMKTCDPLGHECGEGLSCRYWKITWTDGAPLTACHWTGSLPDRNQGPGSTYGFCQP
ncbi:MAG: hypothetical protein IV100_10615 [Myxococcales bacterium]|nr:hypothetical protein [Myxococcales bacterium]